MLAAQLGLANCKRLRQLQLQCDCRGDAGEQHMHKAHPMQELHTCIVAAPVAVPLAEKVRIRLCVRLRKAMERATDICLDIRDEPADLRGSDASP